MASSYVGEIRLWPNDLIPLGWLECNGGLLPIAENQPLFALIGTMYGGDGIQNFALPDLRGLVPVGYGPDKPLASIKGNATFQQKIQIKVPFHTHNAIFTPDVPGNTGEVAQIKVSTANASSTIPTGNSPAILRKPAPAAAIGTAYASEPTPGAYLGGVSGGFPGEGTPAPLITLSPTGKKEAQTISLNVDLHKPYIVLKFIISLDGNFFG